MTFRTAFWQTLRGVVLDPGVALLVLLAVPAYSFFYPLPYATEAVQNVPLAVVDLDASPLSREVISRLAAVPAVRNVVNAATIAEATDALAAGTLAGIVVVPGNFHRDVLRGTPTAVTVFGSGAYPVQDKAILGGVGPVVQSIAGESAGVRLARQGAPAEAVVQSARGGPAFVEQPLYNLTRGYGSYAVAAVGILIVQQAILMGIAALVGTWLERREGVLFGPPPFSRRTLAGAIVGFATFVLIALLYLIGFAFWYQDYPRGGNLGGALAFAALTALTIACLGIALGAWFANRERALQFLLATSIPFLFLCGVVFPRETIPAPLNALATLVPSTPGIVGFVKLNQMGAAWNEIRPEFVNMAALLALYLALAWWAVDRRRRGATASAPAIGVPSR